MVRTPRGKGGLIYGRSDGGSYGKRRSSARGGHGSAGTTPSSQKKRLDGLFLEGNWYCNCEPRAQASHFEVKKKGPNKGKFFYTCGRRKCNFFLWEADAAVRATGVTLTLPPMPAGDDDDDDDGGGAAPRPQRTPASAGPAASLPTPTTNATTARQRWMTDYLSTGTLAGDQESKARQAQAETPSRTAKRKRVLFEFDDSDEDKEDDFGLDDVSSDEERQMTEAMERSAKKLRPAAPSTPSSQKRTGDVAAAAAAAAASSTPTSVSRTLFPDAKRRRAEETAGSPTAPASASSSHTAMPPTPEQEQELDPTEEVLTLLRGRNVDEVTTRSVEGVLHKFAMRAKGVARGRDSVRTALRGKDERIAELQERVASLESRNRVQREEIADFKASIMDLYSKH